LNDFSSAKLSHLPNFRLGEQEQEYPGKSWNLKQIFEWAPYTTQYVVTKVTPLLVLTLLIVSTFVAVGFDVTVGFVFADADM